MKTHVLDSTIWLVRAIDEVFSFFSDAMNLGTLTSPWVNFQVLTPAPIKMALGTRLRYRLAIHRIAVNWESEITTWDPPRRFVDEQIHGPYRRMHHEHYFSEREGGTGAVDHVKYSVPGGSLISHLFVARDLRAIFGYGREKLTKLFP
jgi:ligand-binding SRPBCC domain-containing protein